MAIASGVLMDTSITDAELERWDKESVWAAEAGYTIYVGHAAMKRIVAEVRRLREENATRRIAHEGACEEIAHWLARVRELEALARDCHLCKYAVDRK